MSENNPDCFIGFPAFQRPQMGRWVLCLTNRGRFVVGIATEAGILMGASQVPCPFNWWIKWWYLPDPKAVAMDAGYSGLFKE